MHDEPVFRPDEYISYNTNDPVSPSEITHVLLEVTDENIDAHLSPQVEYLSDNNRSSFLLRKKRGNGEEGQ